MRGLRGCINLLNNFINKYDIDFMITVEIHITHFNQVLIITDYKFFAGLSSQISIRLLFTLKKNENSNVKNLKLILTKLNSSMELEF